MEAALQDIEGALLPARDDEDLSDDPRATVPRHHHPADGGLAGRARRRPLDAILGREKWGLGD